jgi:hypothetical protein
MVGKISRFARNDSVLHGYGLLHSCRPLDDFSDNLRSSARQFSAVLVLLTLPILFDLIRVHPVHADDIPAEDAAICNFPFKPLHKFMRVFPHAKIGGLIPLVSAEHQAYYCKTANESAASFTVGSQPATEGIHCFKHILAYIFTKLFLPDRKNGLASVEKPVKQSPCLFFHF